MYIKAATSGSLISTSISGGSAEINRRPYVLIIVLFHEDGDGSNLIENVHDRPVIANVLLN